MSTQPGQPVQHTGAWWLVRVLLVAGCICFVVAALAEDGVFTGQMPLAWAFGGFAAWVLAGAVP